MKGAPEEILFHADDACCQNCQRRPGFDDSRDGLVDLLLHPRLIFDHRDGATEPMLWIADGVLWSIGAGGRWLRYVDPIVRSLTELGR